MSSPLLALFLQSLSQDCYGRAIYWTRTCMCGLIILFFFIFVRQMAWIGAPGLICFGTIVSLQMAAVSLIGLTYFGSAIAEEREEQTLGLLRMTNLDPLSILLGKSTSRLCGALMVLLAALPFTIVAVTLGGISLGQVTSTYCTLAAYTFLLCNVALLSSVMGRNSAIAGTITAAVMALLIGTGYALEALNDNIGSDRLEAIATAMKEATPVGRLNLILGTHYTGPAATWSEAGCLILGLISFFLAWAIFERFSDRDPESSGSSTGARTRILGISVRRPARPKGNALMWKDFHFLYGGYPGLVLRLVIYWLLPALTLAVVKGSQNSTVLNTAGFFDFWIGMICFIDTGAMAARLYRQELNGQTFSALAILPTTVRRVAYRKAFVLLLVALPGSLSSAGLSLLQTALRMSSGNTFHMQSLLRNNNFRSSLIIQFGNEFFVIALYIHLVIWASLLVKRGALPIGMVATLVASVLIMLSVELIERYSGFGFGSTLGMSYARFNFIVTSGISFLITVFLHFGSLRRLVRISAEG
jgi:hypothetical protein